MASHMSVVSRNRQMQLAAAHGAFDGLRVGTALMLRPPRRDPQQSFHQHFLAVLAPSLVSCDLRGSWRREMLAAYALIRLLAVFDEAWQSVHAAELRSTVECGVIDVSLARFVLSH